MPTIYESKLMKGGEYTKAQRIANLAKARLARGKKKTSESSKKGGYTKEMRIANLAKARLARGKKKSAPSEEEDEEEEDEEPETEEPAKKGVYTKEMRIANLAKARLARGKKKAVVKGKGITSNANNAIETASGKGITSNASNAMETAIGKGYYTQDYVPSDQLNFLGTPLDNMDYAKIRSRREDKRKKGEYTYSKEMAEHEMPIPTISGSGKNKHKLMKHHTQHKRSYDEELINDGYIPRMAMEMPLQYTQLMKGSGWDDFVSKVRDVEDLTMNTARLVDTASRARDSYNRSSASSRPSSRTVVPNVEYNQTNGLYEPRDEWVHVGDSRPSTARPSTAKQSSASSRDDFVHVSEPYSDRPQDRWQTSNIPIERIQPRPTPMTPAQREAKRMYGAYEEHDELPAYLEKEFAPSKPKSKMKHTFDDLGSNNWQDSERTLEDGRKAKRDVYSKPSTTKKSTAKKSSASSRDEFVHVSEPYSDRPQDRWQTSNIPIERIEPRPTPMTPTQRKMQKFLDEERPPLRRPTREAPKTPKQIKAEQEEMERQIAENYRQADMYDANRRGYEREAREMIEDRDLRTPTKQELEEQKSKVYQKGRQRRLTEEEQRDKEYNDFLDETSRTMGPLRQRARPTEPELKRAIGTKALRKNITKYEEEDKAEAKRKMKEKEDVKRKEYVLKAKRDREMSEMMTRRPTREAPEEPKRFSKSELKLYTTRKNFNKYENEKLEKKKARKSKADTKREEADRALHRYNIAEREDMANLKKSLKSSKQTEDILRNIAKRPPGRPRK